MQSPFMQRAPVEIPKVLRPFRYCEFRVVDEEQVLMCPTLACVEIEEMPFCNVHGLLALEGEKEPDGDNS